MIDSAVTDLRRDPPAGFVPLSVRGPYLSALGPVFERTEPGGGLVLGLRLAPHHANLIGVAHGGMLVTVADAALGINLTRHGRYEAPLVTVNLHADFLSSAQVGEWLEARVQARKLGRRLAFADCLISAGPREVLRASAVFTTVPAAPGASDG